jgi:hypothetical protein
MSLNWKQAQQKAALTARWAITMANLLQQLYIFYETSGGDASPLSLAFVTVKPSNLRI